MYERESSVAFILAHHHLPSSLLSINHKRIPKQASHSQNRLGSTQDLGPQSSIIETDKYLPFKTQSSCVAKWVISIHVISSLVSILAHIPGHTDLTPGNLVK